ncbi:MAG: hypothetical protein O2954_06040 [bacterium]|nr:hypothetical protein [bacterium]
MNLTEVDKAAVLLIALGTERAQGVLDRLGTADLVPIVQAMKKMQKIDPQVRREVLAEVIQILGGLNAGPKREAQRGDLELERDAGLLGRIGPLLPGHVDSDQIDWGRAGFDFGTEDPWRRKPPEDEE